MDTVIVVIGAFVAGLCAALLVAERRTRSAGGVDARLVGAELERVGGLVRDLERDRAAQYGELAGQLRLAGEHTARLADSTRALRETLANPVARGQWGERLADDVLRAAGFVEGVNYVRQRRGETGGIPDVTFLLPRGQRLYMDVKFPLDNFVRARAAEGHDPAGAERLDAAFLRDVRARVKELAGRHYPDDHTCVDCVLLFLPNEAVFASVQERDPSLLDDAMRAGVVVCSPLTLFAVLAVIRHAVDSFTVEQSSRDILDALRGFRNEWERFVAHMDGVARRLDSVQREFGALTATRRRALDRRLEHVDDVRRRVALDGGRAGLAVVGPAAGAGDVEEVIV